MMRVMDAAPGRAATQRLPGLTFLPHQPVRGLPLPRLDVAAFIGFAQRGPLNTPVPLEDYSTYQAVFGGDLDLAWEAGEQLVRAHLPRAVQQFFANGGRRCYVVRVAGRKAEAARHRLPGVVALNGRSGPRLAALSASSAGAWGAALRLAARQAVSALPCSGSGVATWTTTAAGGIALQLAAEALRRTGAPTLHAGDVLRLRFDDGWRWLATIVAVERRMPAGSLSELLVLHLGATYRLLSSLEASPPEEVTRLELLTTEGAVVLNTVGLLSTAQEQMALELESADVSRLSTGDMLRLHLAGRPHGDPGYLVRIEELRALPGSTLASPPQPAFAALFSEALQLRPEALLASPPALLTSLELLRLDLLLRLGDERWPAMSALGFNPGHPQFWGDVALLQSSPLLSNAAQAGARSAGVNGNGSSSSLEAAAWHRWLMQDPYDLLPQPGPTVDRRQPPAAGQSFNPVAALAGLLAPAGSHLGIAHADAQAASAAGGGDPYAEAEEDLALVYLPLGLPEVIDEADPIQFRPPAEGRGGSDDLERFAVDVFYDRYLAPPDAPGGQRPGESHRTLMQTAFDLHYVQGRRLRGLHSLLFLDEVAVVAAPDACHDPWQPGTPEPAPAPPRPDAPEQPDPCPPVADFANCDRPPAIHEIDPYYGPFDEEIPVIVRGEGFTSSVATRLFFNGRPAEEVEVRSSHELTAKAPPGVRPGPADVAVETEHGRSQLAGGFNYVKPSTAHLLPEATPAGLDDPVEDQPCLAVHQALVAFCQARADVICLLNVPRRYDVRRCIQWQQALRRRLGLPDLGEGFAFDEPEEIADLSYAAVYHPWLLVADVQAAGRVRLAPPDGAIAGLIAAREQARQAWIAPANIALREVLGLSIGFSDDDWAELFARRFNLVRPETNASPSWRPMSAHTLSGERGLLQISTRRLLILLRKAVMQLGMDYVFQPNHERLRLGMQVALEDFLRFLFQRGAFAGRSEVEAFRVIADNSVNPPQSVEQGRVVMVIQVAPSQPLEFITVQLLRSGEGELLVTEV
ncbi:MAG TPA: IPT/TIG domain-containing protein [Anaerolineae bacterium]|nr:IPT/TIG domain-containing protein [Anaerolineae bacterium]